MTTPEQQSAPEPTAFPEEAPSGGIAYRQELARKSIHLTSLLIPVLYSFLPLRTMLAMGIPMLTVAVTVDLLRRHHPPTAALIGRFFGAMLRPHEQGGTDRQTFTGATYVLIAAVLFIVLLPQPIFIGAFVMLVVGDTAAALVGRRWGAHKIWGKSWEGIAAFVGFSLAVLALLPGFVGLGGGPLALRLGFVLPTVILAALAEAAPIQLDDNFRIPLVAGIALMVLYGLIDPAALVAMPHPW